MSLLALSTALLAGFIVLMFAGDVLVRGAAALARRGGLPPLIVGLTIVAFGTSAPEMFVTVQAVLSGAPGLAIGNVVGSNIANVLLVLSIPTVLAAVPTQLPAVRRNTVIMVVASAIFVALSIGGVLDAWRGAALLAGILAFTLMQIHHARTHRSDPDVRELAKIDAMPGMPKSWPRIWIYILVGLAGLPLGGILIVRGATGLAEVLGVPSVFIGLTVVAVGTSLPELATSVIAAARKHAEVAIGNVVGSNIFNLFMVGGAAGLAGDVPVPDTFFGWDFPVMVLSAVALLAIVLLRRRIGWATGLAFFLAYVVYIVRLAQIEGVI